ncbi:MAG: hypothetical protein R3B47_19960 [Bacteroidia bacterium]
MGKTADGELKPKWQNIKKQRVFTVATAPDSSLWLALSDRLINIHHGEIRQSIALQGQKRVALILSLLAQ